MIGMIAPSPMENASVGRMAGYAIERKRKGEGSTFDIVSDVTPRGRPLPT
jgi:hypothetical protein